ncbi:hypothetical protein [Tateyamaria sp. SN6-1]|uniref:hypothetical protein n=1 Tax=Tateyamaria sp. SN6-1 TaxID=3092148 RepID=UPI0039F44EEF
MPVLPGFSTPAQVQDFPNDTAKQDALNARWSDNINRFTEQTIQNDPWSSINQPRLTQYFNPTQTDVPGDAPVVKIPWTAFPRRITTTFPDVGQKKQWEYADNGPNDPDYGPRGPRGWQDEYCEWSVKRNAAGKITEVMFTCENREYWFSLWEIDPERVLDLYRTLVSADVEMDDLILRDGNGKPVIDRETGRPAYNDRNPWNSTTTNGAVHLISNPNALSAEIFLAGQATILRETATGTPITDKSQLIQCSKYGTPNRNSDPTIGADVNGLVRSNHLRVSLHDPVGLYIQTPNFDSFQLPFTAPAGAHPSDYWTVKRGHVAGSGDKLDFILHAVYKVPEELGFTVGDIMIDGFSIDFASQITEKFEIALAGVGLPQSSTPDVLHCAGDAPAPLPRPYLLCDANMLPAATRSSLNMRMEPGTAVDTAVLVAFDSDTNATIAVEGAGGVHVDILHAQAQSGAMYYTLAIKVEDGAATGNRNIKLIDPGNRHGPAVFGMLEVVPQGTLAQAETAMAMYKSTIPALAAHHDLNVKPRR